MQLGRGFVRVASICSVSLGVLTALMLMTYGAVSAPTGFAARAAGEQASPPPGLRLSVSPVLVDVGDAANFTLQASSWPGPARVVLSLVSPHHGFTGGMVWDGRCGCFRLGVALAERIHPIEKAIATATVRAGGAITTVRTTFSIRGLAAGGRGYAPGGTPTLTGWVSDPSPNRNETLHYCAWVKAADGVGFAGYRVSFVVHFAQRTQSWHAGVTNTVGIRCSRRSIGSAKPGVRVPVDVYANALHTHTSFTPRA